MFICLLKVVAMGNTPILTHKVNLPVLSCVLVVCLSGLFTCLHACFIRFYFALFMVRDCCFHISVTFG